MLQRTQTTKVAGCVKGKKKKAVRSYVEPSRCSPTNMTTTSTQRKGTAGCKGTAGRT